MLLHTICKGCDYANKLREMEQRLEQKCAFCREPLRASDAEIRRDQKKRIKANDPIALLQAGKKCYGEGDYVGAFEYFTKAAELGDMDGHYELSCLYHQGKGVELDKKKGIYHLEEAAIGGHLYARYNLGVYEHNAGRVVRAGKHFIIAANLGYDKALEELKQGFQIGLVKKEDFEVALRGHQAAVDAKKK